MHAPQATYPTGRAPACAPPPRPLRAPLLRLVPGDARSHRPPVALRGATPGRDAPLALALRCRGHAGDAVVLDVGVGGTMRPDVWVDFVDGGGGGGGRGAFEVGVTVTAAGGEVLGTGCLLASDFEEAGKGVVTRALQGPGAPAACVGEFTFEFLVVTPFAGACDDGSVVSEESEELGEEGGGGSTARSSSSSAASTTSVPPMFAGHRGLGSRRTGPVVAENTIDSFSLATQGEHVSHVELDVQLSRDGVPIIHHDWCQEKKQFMYHLAADECQSNDGRPLPTLTEACTRLPPHVGMLVEVKYPPPNVQRSLRIPFPDHNLIADNTLRSLLCEAAEGNASRSIVIMSFDADLCTMFALKQTAYPVYFLHCEERDGPECDDADPRTVCVERGIAFARSQPGIAGMVLFAEMVLEDNTLARRIASSGLSVMTYSDINKDPETALVQLRDLGVQGVIADDVVRVASAVCAQLGRGGGPGLG